MSGTEDSPSTFRHVPVLLAEVVETFSPVLPGWVIDGTVGGGGHAGALLDAHAHLRVLGIDRDPVVVEAATAVLEPYGDRALVVQARFDEIHHAVQLLRRNRPDRTRPDVVEHDGHTSDDDRITGVLLDLGVSSPQLDRSERGFSYRHAGPLDMRMDPGSATSAADLVNTAEPAELVRILRRFGDERHANRIADAIVAARPILTTEQLAEVVRDAIPAPARRTGGHPATRTFQALRIAVNDELEQLDAVLGDALDLLVPGGRMAVITYHSGEDRIVARRFRDLAADDCICPPGTGECRCGGTPSVRLVPRKAIRPSDDEVAANPRARSARLRVAEKLPDVEKSA